MMVNDVELQSRSLEKIQRANRLNEAFRQGKEAGEVLEDLRTIEKPILVDFNNVLFNNLPPLIPNPEAKQFLEDLRKIGDVVIATTASGWNAVHGLLETNGIWSDEMVLMVAPNYSFLASYYPQFPDENQKNLFDQFRVTLKKRGIEMGEYRGTAPARKPLSPLFNKSFDIPLIDDSSIATRDPFPGILGIQTKAFVSSEESKYTNTERGVSLLEAVDRVRDYYSKLTP